jgi:hypothetical protein
MTTLQIIFEIFLLHPSTNSHVIFHSSRAKLSEVHFLNSAKVIDKTFVCALSPPNTAEHTEI